MKDYDLAVIGSGPAGYVAALYAARHNLSVCVIEKGLLGGTCLNHGCIPTKTMLNSASLLAKIKESAHYGIKINGWEVDFSRIAARKDEVLLKLRSGIETLFKSAHVDLIKGRARLLSADTVGVEGKAAIKARSIMIATGSSPVGLDGIEVDEKDTLSSDGILDLKELPKSLLIVGGGVIGCEFACLFNALGSKVTMVELLDRLIATQSREASKKLEVIFKKRGITVFASTKVEGVSKKEMLSVILSNGDCVEAEKILVAVGRTPNTTGLGLEAIGVRTQKGRIVVDGRLRTSIKNIYAVGDCVGGPLLAHKASHEGMVACDGIMGRSREADYGNIPNCIYTDPEIASVGLAEEEAREKYPDAKIAKFPFLASGKAQLIGRPEGYIKLIGDGKGAILGVEIFGEGACDMIGEAVLAKTVGVNIKDLSRIVHGHPTLPEIFGEVAHIFAGTPIHGV
jgi:dihydrolipoamide dehydrogenase